MKRQNKTSEHGLMSADVNSWFTSAQLALLGGEKVIDIPRSERWAGDKAKKLKWEIRRVEGGGGPGGMRTEYQPPADVLAQIHAFLEMNPDFFGRDKKAIVNHSIGYGKTSSSGPLVTGTGKQSGIKLQDHHAAPVAQKQMIGAEGCRTEVLESLLVVCLHACVKIYGEPFQSQDAAVQLGYAADLYNLLVRMSAAMGGNMETMQRLELEGIAQQLQLFIRIGQARRFPPPLDSPLVW